MAWLVVVEAATSAATPVPHRPYPLACPWRRRPPLGKNSVGDEVSNAYAFPPSGVAGHMSFEQAAGPAGT